MITADWQASPRACYFLFRLEIADAFALASDFDPAPQAWRESSSLVGFPSGFLSGPGIPPIRARKDARRGLSPDFTGAFRFIPSALAEARPLALRPPSGFFPALVCQVDDLAMLHFLRLKPRTAQAVL